MKIPETSLSRFRQRLNTAYTTYYNLLDQRSDRPHQGHHKFIFVDADEYLLELSRYIYLNPVRVEKYLGTSAKRKAEILKSIVEV